MYLAWRDWQRGISPGRVPAGRGAQNPDLLEAFALLDVLERNALRVAEAERERRQLEFLAAALGVRRRG